MQTYRARFVRPDGENGTLCVLSATRLTALLQMVRSRGPFRSLHIDPCRRAAVMASWHGAHDTALAAAGWPPGLPAAACRVSGTAAAVACALARP